MNIFELDCFAFRPDLQFDEGPSTAKLFQVFILRSQFLINVTVYTLQGFAPGCDNNYFVFDVAYKLTGKSGSTSDITFQLCQE